MRGIHLHRLRLSVQGSKNQKSGVQAYAVHALFGSCTASQILTVREAVVRARRRGQGGEGRAIEDEAGRVQDTIPVCFECTIIVTLQKRAENC